MSKKLIMLAAGALAVMAFTALPNGASAGEFVATCSNGEVCNGVVEGTGTSVLEEAGGLKVTCTGTNGNVNQPDNSSTGNVQLTFTGCQESAFGTQCQNGMVLGKIVTNSMVSHLVYLEPDHSIKGVLLTGVNVTFNCAGGLVTKTVTGNIIGEIENSECGKARAHHTIKFEAGAATGSKRWTQVTTTGTVFDLTTNNDAGGAYATSSQTGTGTITWNKNVTLDC